MLATVRQRSLRLILAAAVILIMVGAPTVAPAYAGDCSTGTVSCGT